MAVGVEPVGIDKRRFLNIVQRIAGVEGIKVRTVAGPIDIVVGYDHRARVAKLLRTMILFRTRWIAGVLELHGRVPPQTYPCCRQAPTWRSARAGQSRRSERKTGDISHSPNGLSG